MATLTSGWSATGTATLGITRKVWIKSVNNPSLNARIPVSDPWLKGTSKRRRSVRAPLGRTKPVVLSSIESGDSFTVTFTCVGTVFDQVMALINSDDVLLVENESRQWYCKVTGDVGIDDFLLDGSELQAYRVTIPFTEVDKP